MSKLLKRSILAYVIITIGVSVFFYLAIIGEFPRYTSIFVSIFDTLVGGQIVGSLLIGLVLITYGLVKRHRVGLSVGLSLIAGAVVILSSAAIIYNTRFYLKRYGDGGPAGAFFDCVAWNNHPQLGNKLNTYCIVMHVPSLNNALLSPKESYYMNAGPGYATSFVISQLFLIGTPTLTTRRLSKRG